LKKHNSIYAQWFNDFYQHKLYLWFIFISITILATSYFFFFFRNDLIIFPGNVNSAVNFYTDSIDDGKSKIEWHDVSKNSIRLSFTLKEGFIRPYVGITILNKNNNTFNVSGYNQIQFELEGNEIKNIVVYLVTDSKSINRSGNNTKLHFCENIEVGKKNKQFKLYINQFKVPDWWYDVNNLSPNQPFELDLKNVTNINFTTGLTPTVNTRRFLKINSVKFVRNNTWIIIEMVITEVLIILLLLLLHFLKVRNLNKNKPVIITYKPVNIENKNKTRNSFLDYIHENFQNSELNLDLIAHQTGINQRLISENISIQFNCNVKTYINQIRINEAQRLLKETGLNISEIAYKVGFSSPSNFNRVFKKISGISPTEFMQSKQ
jgi:AraC-like DNA-binding protein